MLLVRVHYGLCKNCFLICLRVFDGEENVEKGTNLSLLSNLFACQSTLYDYTV